MKTVFKKMLSLVLVAMLLVTAVPFQASAAEAVQVPLTVKIDGETVNTTKSLSVSEDVVLTADLAMAQIINKDGRTFAKWTNNSGADVTGKTLGYEWVKGEKDYSLTIWLTTEHTHCYSSEVTTEATCVADGVKTFTCECGDTYTESIAALGHSWGEWNVTTAATTTAEGVETRTCATCGATETRAIDKLTDSGYTEVIFRSDSKIVAVPLKQYQVVTELPTPDAKTGYKFVGWYSEKNGLGEELAVGDKWSGEFTTYYAYYEENVDDGLSTVSVYARFYVDGVQQGNTQLLYTQEFKDGANVLKWLNSNESFTSSKIFSIKSTEDYEWEPRYYYNYSGDEPLTEQDLIADGDKSIVVKVYSKKSAEATVLLYVHTKTSGSPDSVLPMTGYTAGNTVTLSAAKTTIKTKYTGTNMTVQGLYTDEAWEQLLNGENPTAANGIAVTNNGTLKIHVLLKNATASSSSTADSTNPKTGDTIFMAVTVMAVSAAALVVLYMMNKKRLVK